jgi:hypothetical protein
MNIELHFLNKAIEDKNYVSFTCENKKYEKVKPLSLKDDTLKSDKVEFSFKAIKKLTVLKERF